MIFASRHRLSVEKANQRADFRQHLAASHARAARDQRAADLAWQTRRVPAPKPQA